MKFTKIDENTVRCIVSKEEMDAYDVELEDFIKKNKKVKDFVELLIDKAVDEVGYEQERGMTQLQLQPLPKMGLAITFSNHKLTQEELSAEIASKIGNDMADAFLQSVENLTEEERQKKLDEVVESVEEFGNNKEALLEELRKINPQMMEEQEIEKNRKSAKPVKGKDKPEAFDKKSIPNLYVCRFQSLQDIGAFSAQIPERFYVKSSIYKEHNKNAYYMAIEKGRCKQIKFLLVCRLALEFAVMETCSSMRLAYLEEQGECLAKDNAIAVFRRIYK